MTDKLAEAIKWTGGACDNGLMLEVQVAKVIVEAARKYHALPVVDVEKIKSDLQDQYVIENSGELYVVNACFESLRALYPNGLKWEV
jgi:hypothetical protein